MFLVSYGIVKYYAPCCYYFFSLCFVLYIVVELMRIERKKKFILVPWIFFVWLRTADDSGFLFEFELLKKKISLPTMLLYVPVCLLCANLWSLIFVVFYQYAILFRRKWLYVYRLSIFSERQSLFSYVFCFIWNREIVCSYNFFTINCFIHPTNLLLIVILVYVLILLRIKRCHTNREPENVYMLTCKWLFCSSVVDITTPSLLCYGWRAMRISISWSLR